MIKLKSSSQCKLLFEEKKDNLEFVWLAIHGEQLVIAWKIIIQLLLFSSTYMYEVEFFIHALIKSTNETADY